MHRVAARLLRAVTPSSAARPLRAVPSDQYQSPPNESPESRRLFGEGLGREAPASPATDKSEKSRFSAPPYGRRSLSTFRRPPQEVAASHP